MISRYQLLRFTPVLFAMGAHATVITVCNEANLQQALSIGGRITFACGGPATIHLTKLHIIDRDIEIDGGGTITLDGGRRNGGMFDSETDSVNFRLSRLTVVNGGASLSTSPVDKLHGGFISGVFTFVSLTTVSVEDSWWPVWLNRGVLEVRGSTFFHNEGSVLVAGQISVLDHSRFLNNRGSPIWSDRAGSAVVIDQSNFDSNSGPVTVANGTLKISGSSFLNSTTDGDGGALHAGSDSIIEESEFTNNQAPHGGAIFFGGNARTVSLHGSKFYSNTATQSGGAIAFERSQAGLSLSMQHIIFQENRATNGGALSLERDFLSHLSFDGAAVAFINNRATSQGGALYAPNANVQLSRGIFIGNQAGSSGGAIASLELNGATTSYANSLLVRNTAPQGAAFWGNSATFVNTTIADNNGTAIWPQILHIGPGAGIPSFLRFVNSIVSGIFAGPCGPSLSAVPYVNGGNNLQFPGSGCGAGIPSANPYLGGYYVPFFWSPALHGGNQAVCDAVPISHKDVYSSVRPQGKSPCAIGAVEGNISRLISGWIREGYPSRR
jgi:predicted outer membrane repeat protein